MADASGLCAFTYTSPAAVSPAAPDCLTPDMLRFIKVSGPSMSPLLEDGDYLLVLPLNGRTRDLKAGKIITAQHPDLGLIVKRIKKLDVAADRIWLESENSVLGSDEQALGPLPLDVVDSWAWLAILKNWPKLRWLG
ncbi:S24/S26 family peptidase [Rhodovibrionaceae bacterium A322]